MKPRLSPAATAVFPSFSPKSNPSSIASSELPSARTTSSRGMTCAGLKKWSPMKRSGRPVDAAWSITDSDEVLVAKTAPSFTTASTSRPDRFLGLHFFNPAQVMPLLEVVQTVTTSDEALAAGFEVGEKLGKKVVHAKDKTGFIVNRLLVPYMLDAIRAYEEGVGSIDEIDVAMKAGANHPMGPLTLADFVGLDTLVAIGSVMFDEYRERRFAAPPTLRKMVAAGWYGRKSGKGFYDYSGEKPVPSELGL